MWTPTPCYSELEGGGFVLEEETPRGGRCIRAYVNSGKKIKKEAFDPLQRQTENFKAE